MESVPNVLVILTDQQRGDAFGAAGNPDVLTPAMDRLAASGIRFPLAFSEAPECVPARATLLTGQTPVGSGVAGNADALSPGSWTFARALRDHGYETWAVGKQHFTPARADHGFDRLLLSEELADPAQDEYLQHLFAAGFDWVPEPFGTRHELYYVPQVSPLPDSVHVTTWTGDRVVEQLEQSAAQQRPFLGVASFVKPHPPFDPTAPYATIYDPDQLTGPAVTEDPAAFPIEDWQTHAKWMEGTSATLARTIRAYYYASITQVDVQVGRILDALDALALRERTLVVFLSDHGELLGDHGHWGKRSYYDGSARVPLVLSWPGRLDAGVVDDRLVAQQDVVPTVLAAAGVAAQALPGRDLLAPVTDQGWRRSLLGTLFRGDLALVAVLEPRWRWSYSVLGGRERLFDVVADPDETEDLAAQAPEVAARMRTRAVAELAAARDDLGLLEHGQLRVLPEPGPEWYRDVRERQFSSYLTPELPPEIRALL